MQTIKTSKLIALGIFVALLTTLINVAIFGLLGSATKVGTMRNTGVWTDGIVTATLDKSGTLTFTGNGALDNSWQWMEAINPIMVKKIVIGDGITDVDNCEFSMGQGYPNLQTVVVKGNIASIGDCAFSGNHSLRTVVFEGDCHKISTLAFFDCLSLEEVTLPDARPTIDWSAFEGCPYQPTEDTPELSEASEYWPDPIPTPSKTSKDPLLDPTPPQWWLEREYAA